MAATVIPFASQRIRDGWTSRELAEIYRLADMLAQRGLIVELEMGMSDEGDPWLVLTHPDEPDVAAHIARIDGRYLVSRGGLIEEIGNTSLRDLLERVVPSPTASAAAAPGRLQPDLGEALLTATLLIALGVVVREVGPGLIADLGGLAGPALPDAGIIPSDRWLQLGRDAMALLAPVAPASVAPVSPDALAGLPPATDPSHALDHQATSALRQWLEHGPSTATADDDPGAAKDHAGTLPSPTHPEGSSTAPDLQHPVDGDGHPTTPTTPAEVAADPAPAGAHSLSPTTEPLPAAASTPGTAGDTGAAAAVVHGPTVVMDSAGHQTVFGTDHGDIIFASSGDDLIVGGNGNNLIVGGSGHDTIFSGSGNDTLIGGSGPSTISGGAGNDVVVGGGQGSVIYGGAGNDLLISGNAVQTGQSIATSVDQQTVVVSRSADGQVTVQSAGSSPAVVAASPPPPPPPVTDTHSHVDTTTTATTATDTHSSTDVTLVGVTNLPHNQLQL